MKVGHGKHSLDLCFADVITINKIFVLMYHYKF